MPSRKRCPNGSRRKCVGHRKSSRKKKSYRTPKRTRSLKNYRYKTVKVKYPSQKRSYISKSLLKPDMSKSLVLYKPGEVQRYGENKEEVETSISSVPTALVKNWENITQYQNLGDQKYMNEVVRRELKEMKEFEADKNRRYTGYRGNIPARRDINIALEQKYKNALAFRYGKRS